MTLKDIRSPDDLKKVPKEQLASLAEEIRALIIDTVGKNGGHLASNLGVVELSIALHRSFSSPKDAIIWDVGHQCYTHKILTGRASQFATIRRKGGLSGFTRVKESEHDFFDSGHASSAISSALGLLAARKLQGQEGKVVAVVGDGALTGGLAFEGLSHAGQLAEDLIVVVNDNQMSIDKNVGALSRCLSQLAFTGAYHGFRRFVDKTVDSIPYFSLHLSKLIFRFKRGLKGLFFTNNIFVDLGFEYVGPLNGHDIGEMEKVFDKAKRIPRPVVIHVVTKKGKGYSPAENDPAVFHGVGPFNTSDGVVEKFDALSFTENFSDKIVQMAEDNLKIAAVTAAMAKGTGLAAFSRRFPERFFDVGIAEEHAVTFAAALAAGGMIPVVAIYSTFIQRSVDQLIEDVALQNRHVVFVFDRAGAVPSDGETHQGIFDIALFLPVPHMTLISVAGKSDMDLCLEWAVSEAKGPVAIRWPKSACPSELHEFSQPVKPGRGLLFRGDDFAAGISREEGQDRRGRVLLVCTGGLFAEALKAARDVIMSGGEADIYSLRFIKPFDEEYFLCIAKDYTAVVFAEDGVETGGISRRIEVILKRNPSTAWIATRVLAFPDEFVANGSGQQILDAAGLSSQKIAEAAREALFVAAAEDTSAQGQQMRRLYG